MATSVVTDFKIYEDEFYSGLTEVIAQEVELFNEASRGAMVLSTETKKGNYSKASFVSLISSLVSRRDITSVAAATSLKMSMDEIISVKLSRKIGPVDTARSAWKIMGETPEEASLVLGQQMGPAIMQNMVNAVVKAGAAALNIAANKYDYSATGGMAPLALTGGLKKFGDRAGDVIMWVMHSAKWWQLVENAISNNYYQVSSIAIQEGVPGTLGRPVLVTDDPSLYIAGSPDTYVTLGLTPAGLVAVDSEQLDIVADVVTGLENIVNRIQGEFAFNVGVKGFKWDTSNGGANPNDAALATQTNWDQAVTSTKDTAGIYILTQ